MVPDTRYHPGLVYIAGNLLLLSPEEDAFWQFVAITDAHLQGYFRQHANQLEVDSTLFATVLEGNDPQLHRRLFVS